MNALLRLGIVVLVVLGCAPRRSALPVDEDAPADTDTAPDAAAPSDGAGWIRTGEPCVSSDECGPEGICGVAPGGYCTGICGAQSECGPNGTCVMVGAFGRCFRACRRAEDCRDGYSCQAAVTGDMVCGQ